MPLNSKITTTNRPVTANGKHRFHKVTQPLPPDYPRQARAATLRQLSTWKSALSTVIVEREAPGGQAGQSAAIENYLGFPKGLTGSDLTRRAMAQASRFGAE